MKFWVHFFLTQTIQTTTAARTRLDHFFFYHTFVKFAQTLTNYARAKCASTVCRLSFVATNAAFVSNLNAESFIDT